LPYPNDRAAYIGLKYDIEENLGVFRVKSLFGGLNSRPFILRLDQFQPQQPQLQDFVGVKQQKKAKLQDFVDWRQGFPAVCFL
jgi:uncharacterized iron-regulated protein